jgi:RND family efflux transporter MFP subunit
MSLDEEALATLRKGDSVSPVHYQTRASQRRRRWLIVAAIVIAAAGAWAVLGRSQPLEAEIVAATAPAAPGSVAVLSASGYVVARRLATVSSEVTGRVIEVTFEEGSEVEAGAVLARLDGATARAGQDVAARQLDAVRLELKEVEIRLVEAVRERDRLRMLRQDGLVSVSALDAAEAEATALAARLEVARAMATVAESTVRLRNQDLDNLVVRAPFAGVIISKDAQPGEMVSPISAGGGFTRTGIATLVDMASREIEVDVNEAYINRVREGQSCEAILDAYPDLRIPAKVIAIVPTADRQKATVRVRIAIEQLDPRILPDMGVKVRFFDDGAGTVTPAVARVPAGAVVDEAASTFVWKVVDGRASRAAVTAGAESEGMRDILAGLAVGDEVVVDPSEPIGQGVRIRRRGGS